MNALKFEKFYHHHLFSQTKISLQMWEKSLDLFLGHLLSFKSLKKFKNLFQVPQCKPM